MALPNTWLLRRVADSSAKACWICYKPSSSVLITSDNKDFFYICLGHLKDRGFCVPDPSEDAAAKERKEKQAQEELEREKEKVIKEYEDRKKEREKRRKDRKEAKDKKKDKDKDKDKDKKDEEEDKKDAEEKEKKIDELAKKSEDTAAEEGPRIFNLSKVFYQQRIDRIRNAENAKRTRELLRNPSTFPSVPKGKSGGTS